MLNVLHYPEIQFPKDFIWGTATAAHQIEGDDIYSDNSHREVELHYPALSGKACDFWNRYPGDFQLMDDLGYHAFRLSVSWARLEPENGRFDEAALAHYCAMFEEMKKHKIKLFLTILHGSFPHWFAKLGEFQKRENLKYFERFVNYLVPKIKDYVDFWLVGNEFNIAYGTDCSCADGRINALRMHAIGYHLIKSYSNAPVSSAHAMQYYVPEDPSDRFDCQMAQWNDWMFNEYFYHAVRTGEVVFPYRDMEEIPELKGAMDYWAINYYTRLMTSARKKDFKVDPYASLRQKMIDMDFYLEEFYPEGLETGLLRLRDLPVYITENGNCCDDDRWRIVKLAMDLRALRSAMDKKVDVRGYLHWSFMDNYEWASFVPRFGLVHVDFETQIRTPKPSAHFFSDIIQNHGFSGKTCHQYLPDMPEWQLY